MSDENGADSYLVRPVNLFHGLMEMARQIQAYWLTLNVGSPPHARSILSANSPS